MNKNQIPFFSCDSCNKEFKIGKCPFDFNPNLKIGLRRRYKLHCLHCGNLFLCPAEFERENFQRKPLCEECIADTYYDDRHDFDSPGPKEDQEMVDEYHRNRYGEY